MSPALPITPGEIYRVQGAAFSADKITFSPKAIWRNAAGAILRTDTLATYTGRMSGWQSFALSLTAPANAVSLTIQLPVTKLNGSIWVDGFSVQAPAQIPAVSSP